MPSRNVYSTLIIIISLFVHANAQANAVNTTLQRSSVLQEIIDTISEGCRTVQGLPQRVCTTTINALEAELKKGCEGAAESVCDALPWPLRIISSETCARDLNRYLCTPLQNAERKVTKFVENECVEELEKLIVGHGCDADGNKVSTCDGLPTTIEGICTTLMDYICDQLPSVLHTFASFCQVTFDSLICRSLGDPVTVTTTTTTTPQPRTTRAYNYFNSRAFAIGFPG